MSSTTSENYYSSNLISFLIIKKKKSDEIGYIIGLSILIFFLYLYSHLGNNLSLLHLVDDRHHI